MGIAIGYRAIYSLRLEKGYVVWGVDVTTETDPFRPASALRSQPATDGTDQ